MRLSSFSYHLNLVSFRYGAGQVISDFLEMTLCALQLGAAEGRYLEIVRRYDKPELVQPQYPALWSRQRYCLCKDGGH